MNRNALSPEQSGGPAQVPMMSPNGSVPPIYVPPGYVSQIIEENGVRRVLVLPQQPEFHPGGHSPLHHAPPPPHAHLPAFMPHPAMLPPPPHLYTGMAGGVGDMSSQYIPQYHPAHIYSEQVSADSHSPHGRPPQFVHRDERASKTYERLQKKLKERQGGERGGGGGGGVQMKDSPPPSPQKSRSSPPSMDSIYNGVVGGGKGLEAELGQGQTSTTAKQTGGEKEPGDMDEEALLLQALLNTVSKPVVTDIQARGAVLSWVAPSRAEGEGVSPSLEPLSYDVSISYSGKDGKYTSVYSGELLSVTLEDLRPATDYHVRVLAVCTGQSLRGSPSEAVAFTTRSCEPDPPCPPRKASGSKSSTLVLQWKAPCDNGSKIHNYTLQWDEGKGTGGYEQCYYGPQKQYRVTKLSPASRYSFRLAAKNDMGVSEFSETVNLYTSCSVPSPPLPPELVKAGVTWLCLTWQRPSTSPKEDDIFYSLEMDEDEGYGFQPSYDGDELSCTVKNLHRSTKYKFRVAAYNTEGKSNPSQVAEFTTCPDRPGGPCRPVIRGRVLPNSFRLAWEPPKDNGGAEVTKYVVEISEGLSGVSWELAYSGPAMEHVCEGLKPGHSYQTRVYCMSEGGQSPLSETLQVQTPAVPPGQCQPPRVVGKPKAREVQLRWGPPCVGGGSPVSVYSVEVCGSGPQGSTGQEEVREVYQGSEVDCTVGSLLPGRTYSFRLRAANKAGYGPLSEHCEVTMGPGAPEPCKAPRITCKSPTVAVVSWETPACNGAVVSEYRVEWGAAEGTMQVCYSGASLTHEVKGLLPATNYFCRVQAVNVAGVGLFSEAVLCQTPPSVPAAVSSVHALKEAELRGYHTSTDQEEEEEEVDGPPTPPLYSPSTCLAVGWEPPCDHGAEISSYLIDLGERQSISVGPVTKYIIQHLQPDTSYRYTQTHYTHYTRYTHTHTTHTHYTHYTRYTHTHCTRYTHTHTTQTHYTHYTRYTHTHTTHTHYTHYTRYTHTHCTRYTHTHTTPGTHTHTQHQVHTHTHTLHQVHTLHTLHQVHTHTHYTHYTRYTHTHCTRYTHTHTHTHTLHQVHTHTTPGTHTHTHYTRYTPLNHVSVSPPSMSLLSSLPPCLCLSSLHVSPLLPPSMSLLSSLPTCLSSPPSLHVSPLLPPSMSLSLLPPCFSSPPSLHVSVSPPSMSLSLLSYMFLLSSLPTCLSSPPSLHVSVSPPSLHVSPLLPRYMSLSLLPPYMSLLSSLPPCLCLSSLPTCFSSPPSMSLFLLSSLHVSPLLPPYMSLLPPYMFLLSFLSPPC
uniref:Fibronectin type III domain containing 3A n=1 Tax=Salmo trutta TaxID=8032 RepID=A0A673WKV3_SALTR